MYIELCVIIKPLPPFLQSEPKSPDVEDPDMFSLDGFDEGDATLSVDPDNVAIATGGGVAFPQSDDEEISTDGKYT